MLCGVGARGKVSAAGSRGELLDVFEADLAETGAKRVGWNPDRRLGPAREREYGAAARRRDSAELLEERDHVLKNDEVERPVREWQVRPVRDLEGDAPGELGGKQTPGVLGHLRREGGAHHGARPGAH